MANSNTSKRLILEDQLIVDELLVDRKTQDEPMFDFEKLETWQKAIAFADLVYEVTREFPSEERFGLTNQTRRAAVSISSNIAEGAARNSANDSARFPEIATGSLFEIVSQSFISQRLGFLSKLDFERVYSAADEQGKMLSGLRRAVLNG
jgi:four helix bundle protein